MKKKVLIYVGNGGGQLRAGLGPWNRLADWKKKSLLEQDPQAERKVLSLEEIFEGKHAEPVEVSSYEECLEHIATAHVLAVCKGTVDSAMIGRAERLESVHILGEDTGHIDLLALHDKKVHVRGVANSLQDGVFVP